MGAVRPTSTLWEQVAGTEAPGFLDIRAELPDSDQEPGPRMLGGPPTPGSWGYSDPGAPWSPPLSYDVVSIPAF